jgi:ubiquinone/menaquinone biosynthesis C-methylase UbiE
MAEGRKPLGAGHGTFDLIDRHRFFEELRVKKSTTVLDIGSGRGDYTIALAEAIGPAGSIYAVDAWEEGLARVRERASRLGFGNVRTLTADVNKGIPLPDRSIDICLMATVLHDLLREGTGEVALRETVRVLRPHGRLVIVEFKKVENGPGPPVRIRLSEKEAEEVLSAFGFNIDRVADIGPYHYLLIASLPLKGLSDPP